jgi:alpha-beta hydrolase superfamily lysophospholipase
MPLTHQNFNLVSVDGTAIKGRFWKPKKPPIATICLIHGIGEHSGRYDVWARKFCKNNIMVFAIDYRGHGLSAGKRGHINHIDEYLDDIAALVRRCKRNHEDIPTFIYGHSMGGNLALSYLLKRRQDFAGAIITSPWLGLVNPPSPIILKIGKLVNRLFPKYNLKTGIKPIKLSDSTENPQLEAKDPLMHGNITVRAFLELDKSASEIMTKGANIHLPMIICHGEADDVTRHDFSQNLATSNPQGFTFKSYPGALHELHNETLAEKLFDDILEWMMTQIENPNRIQFPDKKAGL